MTKVLTYFEIDVDYCANVYGAAPCTASVPTTGAIKCFNGVKTCQDRANFANSPVTLRFAMPTAYLPADIECIPSITGVSFSAATISLGENLGQRATISVGFEDHRHSDTGPGGDKYLADRPYNPFTRGTFFGKFRARQPYLRGRPCRLIRGVLGQTLADMETHHFVMDSFEGPTPDGAFTIVAKDILKLADDDRSQAPTLSNGALVADILSTDFECTLSPSGIGDAEYPPTGYVAIGGKEVCAFIRDVDKGNDANTVLLAHFNGADAATATVDSSVAAHTLTANGNAQLDTADKVFGPSSALFDGTGDFYSSADHADWTFAGDFVVECRTKITSLAAARTLVCHSTDINNMWRLYVTTTGRLQFDIVSASSLIRTLQSSAGAIAINTWYHVAIQRSGNNWSLFVNGVTNGTFSAATTIPNFTSTLKIGISGDGTADAMLGWIDEVRISKVARWSTLTFTVPPSPYQSTGDVLQLTRAQYSSTAVDHKAEDRVQLCLRYTAQDAADIIRDLFVTYAGIPDSYVKLANWKAETAAYLARIYTTIIAEPTGVNQLVSELVEQAALAVWWDDVAQTIRLQVLRAIATGADVYDASNTMEGTLGTQEQPEKYVSEVWTYYGQRNPLEPLDNKNNYRSARASPNLQIETDYGSSSIREIFSRWIPQFGRSVADRVNDIVLARFQTAPRAFNVSVFRTDGVAAPLLGGGYQIGGKMLQDATGAEVLAPVQITRLTPSADRWTVNAEEMLFAGTDVVDLANRVITVDSNAFDFDLKAVHDTLYPPITSWAGITLTCIVNAGVTVGASTTAAKAFDVGTWPVSPAITIKNNGRIQGCGGLGGNGVPGAPGTNGSAGGIALYTRTAISLQTATGEIWGGGGGGGGQGQDSFAASGGGGGAGTVAGGGGAGSVVATNGANGTATAGGAGGAPVGHPGSGGAGGGPGLAGAVGTNGFYAGGAGGARGAAIDGISYVSVTVGPGDRRGSEIN